VRALRIAVLALLAGSAPARAEEILVAAAASLREPLARIARDFEAEAGARAVLSFGASSGLAAQLRAGAPFHVLLSADERTVEALERGGRLAPGTRVAFAGNRLVAIAAAGRPLPRIAADLVGPSVRRFALPPAAVPLGGYAREWLARQGLLQALAGRVVVTEDARATLAAVDAGLADAALVYASDARLVRAARIAFEIPAAEQPRVRYVAALTPRGTASPASRAFVAHLLGRGAAALAEAGLAPPPAP
jgi:molybdate transport system substrate-binding protein